MIRSSNQLIYLADQIYPVLIGDQSATVFLVVLNGYLFLFKIVIPYLPLTFISFKESNMPTISPTDFTSNIDLTWRYNYRNFSTLFESSFVAGSRFGDWTQNKRLERIKLDDVGKILYFEYLEYLRSRKELFNYHMLFKGSLKAIGDLKSHVLMLIQKFVMAFNCSPYITQQNLNSNRIPHRDQIE